MDVLFFFKQRTRFIRHFYETAGMPFRETKRKIEAKEPPFDDPPYSEDGEPPYVEEWIAASEAREVLGRTCLSMLSTSLQLYFMTWEKELAFRGVCKKRKRLFKHGFFQHYRTCFTEVFGLSWKDCPADLELIEQIILARNRDQHPENITTLMVMHDKKDLKKYPFPFFMSESERQIKAMEAEFLMRPTVYVSPETLYQAVAEMEKLTDWLEEQMLAVYRGEKSL